jgi:hypothetical protein
MIVPTAEVEDEEQQEEIEEAECQKHALERR